MAAIGHLALLAGGVAGGRVVRGNKGGVRGRRLGGGQCVLGDDELVMGLQERRKGWHGQQHLLEDVVLGVETMDELVHEGSITDGAPAVCKGVSESLKAMIVCCNGEVTLFKVVQVLLELNGVAIAVAEEEVGDLCPHALDSGVIVHHHVEEVISQSGMEPHEDGEILLDLYRIVGSGRRVVDVVLEIEPVEDDLEQPALPMVCHGRHVEANVDKAGDVDGLSGTGERGLPSERGGVMDTGDDGFAMDEDMAAMVVDC
ncbi:hypothetical protein U9M48_002128 [Paspalum notatum var. saurae]|uniref:Uncharacterized protein n=1 Tax=Paspalum notatum var. saurae TaxID=547442 RepID=A0AAQ3PNC2_PASNO